jgi:large subunit ribosomal protein L25
MASEVTLKAQLRQATGSSANKKLKRAGAVPAVIYGHGNPENLQLSAHDLGIVLGNAVGEHFLVALDVEGEKASRQAILQDVQHHPVTGEVLHVDLMRVKMNEEITSTVPVESVGESVGVKTQGGLLEQSMHEIEIECLPKNLPDLIRVDVSQLRVGDSITIGELKLPAGVMAVGDPEQPVFVVAEPNVAVEAAGEEIAAISELPREKPSKTAAEGSKA